MCANSAQKRFCCILYMSMLHIKTQTQKVCEKSVQKSPLGYTKGFKYTFTGVK